MLLSLNSVKHFNVKVKQKLKMHFKNLSDVRCELQSK